MLNIFIPDDVRIIMNKLSENGYKSYIVGGCLRDSILMRPIHDWDICTSAKPNEMLEIFKEFHVIETGIKHGTITIVLNENNYEVTTFRIDGNYNDNRHPDSVEFVNDITLDLSRRDFTINAMAYNLLEGLIDPFRGYQDLQNKIIKCVGNPSDRFQEDALRMLRAVRFSAQLDFIIEDKTYNAIKENKCLIKNISKERINAEIVKILMSDNPVDIWKLKHVELMEIIIPYLDKCFGVGQNNPFHNLDIGKHIVKSLINSPKDLEIRLALMLHDIGKVDRKTTDENGIDHFIRHEIKSAHLAKRWLEKYRFDNNTINNVFALVMNHDCFVLGTSKKSIKRLLNKLGVELTNKVILMRKCDILAQSSYMQKEKLQELEEVKLRLTEIIMDNEAFKISDLAINGNDMIELGYKPSKELGNALSTILEMVIDDPTLNTKNQLQEIASKLLTDSTICGKL
jgi:tRNA nucleotidyltransferase (CCA-adding enzyme)